MEFANILYLDEYELQIESFAASAAGVAPMGVFWGVLCNVIFAPCRL
ncbi:MAG: hypothetical protein MJY82_03780 [Fibrobacter sp.]|nr:hypothetical protein [Fibrobacter sp.]